MPEATPLASAGSGDREHTGHHRDLGNAVEALERNVALRHHDHSGGDPLNPTDKLRQANTHEDVDTDTTAAAIHHTLGAGATQAAPGNHAHDYHGPSIFNKPLIRCTSDTRPHDPKYGDMIIECDTNRIRGWMAFPGNTLVVTPTDHVHYEYSFDTNNHAKHLDPAIFEQRYVNGYASPPFGSNAAYVDYDATNPIHGALGAPRPGRMRWYTAPAWQVGFNYFDDRFGDPQGTEVVGGDNRCIARAVVEDYAVTATDDQHLILTTSDIGRWLNLFYASTTPAWELPPALDGYLRMSEDGMSYVRASIALLGVGFLATTTGPAGEKFIGAAWCGQYTDAVYEFKAMGNTYVAYLNGQQILAAVDNDNLAAVGEDNRGWGVGMWAGASMGTWGPHQNTPPSLGKVEINDIGPEALYGHETQTIWQLLPVGAFPMIRLRQGTRQQLMAAGTTLTWTESQEDDWDFWNPAAPTDVVVREPGLYTLDAALQWDPTTVPDIAHLVVYLNGSPTDIRSSAFLRGNNYTPGFSQTQSVHGKIRLAANDVLTVRVSYVGSGSIYSYVNGPTNIKSRLDLTFEGA